MADQLTDVALAEIADNGNAMDWVNRLYLGLAGGLGSLNRNNAFSFNEEQTAINELLSRLDDSTVDHLYKARFGGRYRGDYTSLLSIFGDDPSGTDSRPEKQRRLVASLRSETQLSSMKGLVNVILLYQLLQNMSNDQLIEFIKNNSSAVPSGEISRERAIYWVIRKIANADTAQSWIQTLMNKGFRPVYTGQGVANLFGSSFGSMDGFSIGGSSSGKTSNAGSTNLRNLGILTPSEQDTKQIKYKDPLEVARKRFVINEKSNMYNFFNKFVDLSPDDKGLLIWALDQPDFISAEVAASTDFADQVADLSTRYANAVGTPGDVPNGLSSLLKSISLVSEEVQKTIRAYVLAGAEYEKYNEIVPSASDLQTLLKDDDGKKLLELMRKIIKGAETTSTA